MVIYSLLPLIFILGCSTISGEKYKDIEQKVLEFSGTVETLEKRIDDLSRAVSLIINDGNMLHNEVDAVNTKYGNIQQKTEEVEMLVKNLGEYIDKLGSICKAMEGDFNKQIDDIKKAEIELSNRLEVMKMDIKNTHETPKVP